MVWGRNFGWIDGGPGSLRVLFPRMFDISNQKERMEREIWNLTAMRGRWELSWCRELFMRETDLLGNLLGLLDGFASHGGRDRWVCGARGKKGFFRQILL